MKKETMERRVFNRINKEYPLLRKSLRAYFIEVILLTYESMRYDEGYDDMNDSELLAYSYEINTCDEYHAIINDFDTNLVSENVDYFEKWYEYKTKFSMKGGI